MYRGRCGRSCCGRTGRSLSSSSRMPLSSSSSGSSSRRLPRRSQTGIPANMCRRKKKKRQRKFSIWFLSIFSCSIRHTKERSGKCPGKGYTKSSVLIDPVHPREQSRVIHTYYQRRRATRSDSQGKATPSRRPVLIVRKEQWKCGLDLE